MKKYFVSIFSLILISISVMSQTQKVCVTGEVCTTDGHPADGVSVYIAALQLHTITDEKGRYKLTIPPGEWCVIFTSFGIDKVEQKWVVCTERKRVKRPTLYVKENSKELQEVVVTGYSSPYVLSRSIYNTRIVSQRTIREKGATRMEDILNTTVGFRMRPDNLLGETDFELMGAGGNNLKVLIDGVPMLDRGENKQSLGQIDVSSIERIEIVEGPMSVLYGTDALAGVVNIITHGNNAKRSSASVLLQEESLGGSYAPLYGKGLHRQSVSFRSASVGGWYGGAGISHYANSGWRVNKEERNYTWNPKKQLMPHIYGGYADSIWRIHYRLDYVHERVDVAGKEMKLTTVDDKILTHRATHQLQTSYKRSGWQLENVFSFQHYLRNTFRSYLNMEYPEQSTEEKRDDSRYTALFDRLSFSWTPARQISLLSGWEIQADKGMGSRISGHRGVVTNALFASADYGIGNSLVIRPGVRAVTFSNDRKIRVLPSLHIRWTVSERMTVRLSWAYGFRAPKLRELYFDFQDADHNIVGNPELKPEQSYSMMAHLTRQLVKTDRIQLESQIGGFFNHFSNRIIQVASIEKDGQYTYANSYRYKTTGLSMQHRLRASSFSAELTFAYVGRYTEFEKIHNEQTDAGVNRFRFSPEVSFSSTWWIRPLKTSWSVFYKFTGSRYNYYYNPILKYVLLGTDAYHWLDITASRQMNKWLSCQVGVKNLLDLHSVRDTDPGAHPSGSRRFLGSGRTLFCSLNMNF